MVLRFIIAAILFLGTVFCTGCYGATETDAVAYIMILGIDKAEDGKQKVTYQIALPRALGSDGSEGKSAAPQKSWTTTTLTTPTPAESRMLLNSTTSRLAKSNHVIAYVFSEEVARQGLSPSVLYAIRNRDYRETIYIIVVKGSAEEYIKQNKPTLETTIVRFYETSLLTSSFGSYYLPSTYHQFYTRLKNNGGSAYTTYSGINPMTGEDKPQTPKTPEQKGSPYLPGGIPRTGTEDPIEFLGLAVFRGDKMIGTLDSDETMAVAILEGRLPQTYIDVVDPLHPEKDYISLNARSEAKPKIITSFNDGVPIFNIDITIDAEILGITSGTNYESKNFRPLLEAQIANMFRGQILAMIKHTQALGTDPAGLAMYLRPNFESTAELDKIDTTNLYQTADIRVNVTAKLRRTGLIWRTTPMKKE